MTQSSPNARVGKVVATSLSLNPGVPKNPQSAVEVYLEGIRGDFHAGPINKHKKSGPPEPNTRSISIVAREVTEAVSRALEIELKPGDLGENFLVEGLGDLSDLEPGDLVRLGPTVTVIVTKQNAPCSTLAVHHPEIVEFLKNQRGIVGRVLHVGFVKPGDRAEVRKK
ncbi:MAG: MOSC domain-containing protein [Chloroflexi bacterium]|nr:MOSC domain-containing protein [Chloroflexota bacterium]